MERAIRWQYPGKQYHILADKPMAKEVKQISRAEKVKREDRQLRIVSYVVAVAAVVCVFFSFFVPDIAEDFSIPAWYGLSEGTGIQIIEVTAYDIYSAFLNDGPQNEWVADRTFSDNTVCISGAIASWGVDENGRSYVMLYSDKQGGEGILCHYASVIDLDQMEGIFGTTIEISGICAGFTGGKVVLNEAFSEAIPTVKGDLG
jgi:hypothetical protein